MDTLTLKIAGKELSGWESVRVTRGIERMPSDFELSLTDYFPADGPQIVNPGDPCEVYLGEDKVITGYVDRWNASIGSSEHAIQVTGRGKCQDLVDCSADYEKNVINGVTALTLSQKLASVYGINVTTDVNDYQTVPQFTINWGESAQEVIERVCRWAGVLYYDLPDGGLFLTRVSTKTAMSGVDQGVNIQQADYSASVDQRFSEYVGVSLGISPAYSLTANSSYDRVLLATANDPEMENLRGRKHITIVESTLIQKNLAQTAITWEMNRRYGRSKVLKVRVDSWRDIDGILWTPNTLIPIHIPAFGLEDLQWTLAEVEFLRNGKDGTTAQLTLMPPEAFSIEPYAFYADLLKGPGT